MTAAYFAVTPARIRYRSRAPILFPALAMLAIAVAFLVSPLSLGYLGIAYESSGGSLAGKIHPATYLLALALLARLVAQRPVVPFLLAMARGHRGAAMLTWMVATLIAYVAVNLRLPFSALIDTYVFPIMALLLLDGIDEPHVRPLALLLHVIYAANAALGLFEMATGWQLTPLIAMGIDLSADHRSTALFGHPLGNAMVTGFYVVVLAVGGGRDLPGWMRGPAMALQVAAMVSFGGRAALVAMLGILALLGLRAALLTLAGRRFRVSTAATALILAPALAIALAGAYQAGFFDQLLDRFVADEGSAQTRVVMFDLFHHFSWFQLLFGPDQALLRSLMWTEGTEFGIESFWISFLLTYGAVPSLLFFLAFVAFCVDLVAHTRKGSAWPVLYFIVVVSGSLSIGGKTLALGLLVICDMVLLRLPAGERAAVPWPDGRAPPC